MLKRTHIILSLVLTGVLGSFHVNANRQVDSLFTLLKKSTNDTIKVGLELKIANLLLKDDSVAGMREMKKIMHAINALKDKKFAFKSLDKAGRIYYTNGFPAQAWKLWTSSLQLAKSSGDKEWQAKFYNRLGWYMQREDLPKQAIPYYDSALVIAKNGPEKLLSEVLMQKGRAHYDIGDYKNAMDHYIAAQRIFEKNKWMNEEYGHLLHFIGSVFKQQNFYEKALGYYQKELELARTIKNNGLEAEALYLCAGMLGTMGKLDEELVYLQKAIEIFTKEGNTRMLALMYNNLSNNYADKGDYKKAIESCEKALEVYEETGDREMLAAVYRSLGTYHSKLGDDKKALAYFERAMEAAKKVETKQLLNRTEITEAMALSYARLGNYKKAFDLILVHRSLNDSLTNQSNTEYLHNLEKEYETEKKEKEIALLNADKKAKDEELLRKQSQGRTLIIISVLGVLVAGISVAAFMNKRKTSLLLSRQVQEINYQNEIIKEKNKDITDSIQYAKRLQEAVFPEANTLNNYFAESFILFRPKDIVSGDFYWFEEVKGKTIIAVGDCTGHGVPGAFMSILGHNILNQVILEQNIMDPAEILRMLDKQVSNALNKKGRKEYNDGMDIAICVIDKAQKRLSFAGANRPLVIKTNSGLKELKANKFAIGGMEDDRCKVFLKQEMDLSENDVFYLFSDGYYDQFGGPNGKKFKYKRLIEQISGIASKPLKEQENILSNTLETWRGNLEQLDDICILGVRL